MAKFLLSTLPVDGHLLPAVAAALKLQAAGHSVLFALPESALQKLPANLRGLSTGTGTFTYVPVGRPTSWRDLCTLLSRLEGNARYVIADWTISELEAMRRIVLAEKPDVVVADCLHLAPLLVARECGILSAVLGVTPFRSLLPGSAPIRTGLPHGAFAATRAVWNTVNRLIRWTFKGVAQETIARIVMVSPAAEARLDQAADSIFNVCKAMSDVYLQCSVPALEDRPNILVKNGVYFIGPMNETALSPAQHASWLSRRIEPTIDNRARIAFVTWGTMQKNGPPPNFVLAVKTLVRSPLIEEVIVVAPTDHRTALNDALASEDRRSKVTFTRSFGDFTHQLKRADVFISNGGFGGVKKALSLGIPVVCFGDQDDKPDVCGRVKRSGAGISHQWLSSGRRIAHSAFHVLASPRYRTRAEEIGWALYGHDVGSTLVDELELLLRSR